MIDLSRVKEVLEGEVTNLISERHGLDLDDSEAIVDQTRSKARTFRAEKSREMLLLADRLDLVANLVRNEYWYARGETDPLNLERGNA